MMDFPGGTLEQYDQVIDRMGLTPGGDTPPGALFHWVAATDEGIRVVDVWESQEQFDKFAEEQIGPYSRAVGSPSRSHGPRGPQSPDPKLDSGYAP